MKGVVVKSNPEPPVLTVEAEVEAIDWTFEPFDDSIYDGWHYDGLPLMPKKLEQLKDLTEDLIEALEGTFAKREDALNQGGGMGTSTLNQGGALETPYPNQVSGLQDESPNQKAIIQMMNCLLESNLYDVSREMTRARYRIERLLSAQEEPALKALADRLRHQKGMLMNHDSRNQVARWNGSSSASPISSTTSS